MKSINYLVFFNLIFSSFVLFHLKSKCCNQQSLCRHLKLEFFLQEFSTLTKLSKIIFFLIFNFLMRDINIKQNSKINSNNIVCYVKFLST